jgi:hypothetical protein
VNTHRHVQNGFLPLSTVAVLIQMKKKDFVLGEISFLFGLSYITDSHFVFVLNIFLVYPIWLPLFFFSFH